MGEIKQCECGCGRELRHHNKQARFYESNCRERARKRVKTRPFVMLDGEAQNGVYTLLAARTGQYVYDRKGLSTEDCLDFLLSLPRGSQSGMKPVYIWFAMDYDVNMILGDLPLKGEEHSIEELRRTNVTRWRGYRIEYLRRKIFRVSRGNRRFSSTDGWGFFQATFENALTQWKIPVPEIITEGKKARGNFDSWSSKRLLAYNQAELDQGTQMYERLREAIEPLDLAISSWHGPGALAGSWLRKNGAKNWKVEYDDPGLADSARRAYFGGRIDTQGYGIIEPVYHFDIVSAYPSAIRFLPNLSKIEWRLGKGSPPTGGVFLARIRWGINSGSKWGPFPWRGSNGIIRYPLVGEGWYWNYEVNAAIKKFGKECFEFIEYYNAEGEITYPFKELVEESFAYRKQLKAEGHPSNIPVKLVLNSLYGKFAQTVGTGTYYSPLWAGLITSYTRAELMQAITDDVVCVMTDSIWSKTPLNLSLGSELGQWESQNETRMVLAEAGLYQATDDSGKLTTWQRGFDKKTTIDLEQVVKTWLYDDPAYAPVFTVRRFIGMGLASMTSHPWREWVDIDRTIHPVPMAGTTKRLPHYPLNDDSQNGASFISLDLRPRDKEELSYPYLKDTQDMQLILERLEDECEE